MERILTTPEALDDKAEKVFVTGNHFVAIPYISDKAIIKSFNIVRMDMKSLVEFSGEPLLKPEIYANKKKLELGTLKGGYLKEWIPEFTCEESGFEINIKIFAPEKIKGFVYSISIKNKSSKIVDADCLVTCSMKNVLRTIFHSSEIECKIKLFNYKWTDAILLEASEGIPVAALAVSGSEGYRTGISNGGFSVGHEITLKQGEEKTLYYYFGTGTEADGAALNNMDMRRRGGINLFNGLFKTLQKRRTELEDERLAYLGNLNRNFCYYYSIACTLDTEETVLMTSRSSRYYVSCAFWSRDTLLWAFPSILIMDVLKAREILEVCFTRYLSNISIHALYINGCVLYPGFELDELVAPLIALGSYIESTGDLNIENEEWVKKGVCSILKELENWKDEYTGLYKTELDPSDDPVDIPNLTYLNVITLRALKYVRHMKYAKYLDYSKGMELDIDDKIERLEKAIWENCTGEYNGKRIFLWSTDGRGKTEIYDNPPGSLVLLPYYGFCPKDNEIYQNTVKWIFSDVNQLFFESSELFGQGSVHAEFPWVMSLCNYLLSNGYDSKFVDVIKRLDMDNGIACESFDINTGRVKTGAAFATFAGYFSNMIFNIIEK